MEPYFLFFIGALLVIAIVISCLLRCRVLSRRRRQAGLQFDAQGESTDAATATGGYNNTGATNISYYYGQNDNNNNYNYNYNNAASYGQFAGGGLYSGQPIARQPGQTVMPATVLLSNASGADATSDALVTQLFPQARPTDGTHPGPNGNPYGSSQGATNYVPPNSVFYDRDMHRDANGDAVYGAATYLPRPPSVHAEYEKSEKEATTLGEVASTVVTFTVPAKLSTPKDTLSSDSSTR